MNIVLLGLNHHSAPVELRERMVAAPEDKNRICAKLVDSSIANEVVVISTCNRTEIFICTDEPDAATEIAGKVFFERSPSSDVETVQSALYEKRDSPAVRHLFEVVTSLDSLVIGEPHIIGQVRDDFEIARRAGTVGKVMGRLFLRALELGKAVRKETSIGESPVSVSSIALDLAARVFGTIQGRTVVVIGAGEMSRQTAILAGHRRAERIVVSSRTLERARALSDRVNGEVYPWERREEAMALADVVITSTGSKEPIIGREQMARVMQGRRNRPVFIIDIAVPRDVDPSVDDIYNLYRYDLDDLIDIARENENRRKGAVPEVRSMIEEARHDYENWRRELSVVPTIVSMREHIEEIRRNEVGAHLRRMHSLDERDKNMVEALSHAIVNKVLHQPTVRLKEAASSGTDYRHASSLRYLFDLKFLKKDENKKREDDKEDDSE